MSKGMLPSKALRKAGVSSGGPWVSSRAPSMRKCSRSKPPPAPPPPRAARVCPCQAAGAAGAAGADAWCVGGGCLPEWMGTPGVVTRGPCVWLQGFVCAAAAGPDDDYANFLFFLSLHAPVRTSKPPLRAIVRGHRRRSLRGSGSMRVSCGGTVSEDGGGVNQQ